MPIEKSWTCSITLKWISLSTLFLPFPLSCASGFKIHCKSEGRPCVFFFDLCTMANYRRCSGNEWIIAPNLISKLAHHSSCFLPVFPRQPRGNTAIRITQNSRVNGICGPLYLPRNVRRMGHWQAFLEMNSTDRSPNQLLRAHRSQSWIEKVSMINFHLLETHDLDCLRCPSQAAWLFYMPY